MLENRTSYDFYLLIPYYNNLPGLIRSLETISYPPNLFAILIVDDGSVRPLDTKDLVGSLPENVSVTLLRQAVNGGITKALNTGLAWIEEHDNCRYVARLDCGDLCAAERFQKQVSVLDAHSDIMLVGSWCIFKNF